MRTFLVVMAAVFGALGCAVAEASALRTSSKIRNPSAPLTSLHAEALIPIVTQLGLSYEGVSLPSGEKVLLVTSATGRRFQITPMACEDTGRCRGMHLVALFKSDAAARTVSAFNDRYSFVSAGRKGPDMAYLSRYEIADFGMPRGNVGASIDVFLETADLFAEHLQGAARGLKQAPDASDLAAAGLNTRELRKRVSARTMDDLPGFALHTHAPSFETTSTIVSTFVRANELYPGKIVNDVTP